jgi:hypothetical protein
LGQAVRGEEMKYKREKKKNARKWGKVRNAVVHRDARWKCETCTTTGEKETQKRKQNKSIVVPLLGTWETKENTNL